MNQAGTGLLNETAMLQAALVLVFVAEVCSGDVPRTREVDQLFGFSAEGVESGQIWRLLTPALLHTFSGEFENVGVQHLVLNSLVLWIVGPSLRIFVTSVMWWTTVVAGAAGGFTAVWIAGTDLVGFGGSSAITWSLMCGALMHWARDAAQVWWPFRIGMGGCVVWLIVLQVTQVLRNGVQEPQVVHAGAACAGAAVGFVASRSARTHLVGEAESENDLRRAADRPGDQR